MDIKQVVSKYQAGTLSRDDDMKGTGGFWDLAYELATVGLPEMQSEELAEEQDNEVAKRQEVIYNALQEVMELSK